MRSLASAIIKLIQCFLVGNAERPAHLNGLCWLAIEPIANLSGRSRFVASPHQQLPRDVTNGARLRRRGLASLCECRFHPQGIAERLVALLPSWVSHLND
jgi:hypothetical protein